MALFRRLWRNNATRQSRLHFKDCRLLHSIKIHIVEEDRDFQCDRKMFFCIEFLVYTNFQVNAKCQIEPSKFT